MIYIVIVLSSIMAFYFFTMAFIGEKENVKQVQESSHEKEVNNEVVGNESLDNSYYEMPQIEKVKDITYGIPQIPVERSENATAQIPQIVESKNVTAITPAIVEKNEEPKSIEGNETLSIPSFIEKSDDKIINDDEVI